MATQASAVTIVKLRQGSILRRRGKVENCVDTVDFLIKRDFKPVPQSKPRPLLMGIDPGLNGAIAVFDIDRRVLIDMIDMPTYKKPSESRKQGFLKFIDIHKLSADIDLYAPQVALAVLEEPGSMPGQGLESTFRFGRICGQIHGVLAGHYVPVAPVKPAVWKSALALSGVKAESKLRANIEFPAAKELWVQAQHNDRAEAALLCTYGFKYFKALIDYSRR